MLFTSTVKQAQRLLVLRSPSLSLGVKYPELRLFGTRCLSNDHLRSVFDNERYFAKFTKSCTTRSGLFRNSYLDSPKGLLTFSSHALKTAQSLVVDMLGSVHTTQGRLDYIKKLDRLSDVLCRVIDVAEFIRATHPSQQWVRAAQKTHEMMFEYMNQLNTNVELYQHLKHIFDDPEIVSQLSHEEIQVGRYLQQDFERSGIHMDPITRDQFVSLNQEISVLGSRFNNELANVKSYWCELERHEFDLIDPKFKKDILAYQSQYARRDPRKVYVVLAGEIPYQLLSTCQVESVRKKIWLALHSSPEDQISVLNAILEKRARLATMLGYSSFAEYSLEHKMAKSPENVMTFLESVQEGLREGVEKEMRWLKNDSNDTESTSIPPWDRDFLLHSKPTHSPPPDISPYLSVGTIMAGLSALFKSLYNVEFVPEPTHPGETWDAHVRKLRVYDHSTKEDVGFLYVDFWSSKVLPSHFTIVCSRDLLPQEDPVQMEKEVQMNKSKSAQLPVVTLVCNFAKATSIGRFAGIGSAKPTLLSLDEVDTVFHEVGHAMHSMLGRTALHNLSGTRGATDFVELPSVLMESFSKDPRVLGKIAKHYSSDDPIDLDLLNQHRKHAVVLASCELFMQSKMAVLDQVLHGTAAANAPSIDSAAMYHASERKMAVFADEWSTWHGKFPHLFSYAAVYYSYLFDRAMADLVWKGLFEKDPWSSEAGRRYRESVLNWGGTRDPWVCLGEALERKELSEGGGRAMREIAETVRANDSELANE